MPRAMNSYRLSLHFSIQDGSNAYSETALCIKQAAHSLSLSKILILKHHHTSFHHLSPSIPINTTKMQYSSIVITLFASLATASPLQKPQFGLCSSAFDTAQSCDVCVDDVANLDCDSRLSPLFAIKSIHLTS